jgi:hypothetical protein
MNIGVVIRVSVVVTKKWRKLSDKKRYAIIRPNLRPLDVAQHLPLITILTEGERMIFRTKYGWPVVGYKNKPITNFIRLLIHTDIWKTLTFKAHKAPAAQLEHNIIGSSCWCEPEVEDCEEGKIIIHNQRH